MGGNRKELKRGFIGGFFRRFGFYERGIYKLFFHYEERQTRQQFTYLKKKLRRFVKYKIRKRVTKQISIRRGVKIHKTYKRVYELRYKNKILFNKFFKIENKLIKQQRFLLMKLKLFIFKRLKKKSIIEKSKYKLNIDNKKRILVNKIYFYPHLIKISFNKIEVESLLKASLNKQIKYFSL